MKLSLYTYFMGKSDTNHYFKCNKLKVNTEGLTIPKFIGISVNLPALTLNLRQNMLGQ